MSLLLLAVGALAAPPLETPVPTATELAYRAHREWSLRVPDESFLPLRGAFEFETAGLSFPVSLDGTDLAVDTDADGGPDVRIASADAQQGQTGLVMLQGTAADGTVFRYAARVRDNGGWEFAPSGAMTGKLGETPVQLIDRNGNGRYDDLGADAIVVGRGEAAAFLGDVISVAGELLSITVAPDGSRIETTPFAGAVGELDVHSEFEVEAKLDRLVLLSEDGRRSFELGRERGAITLPAGAYRLHSGGIALGEGSAEILPGRSEGIEVIGGESRELRWGGPIEAEFLAHREGAELAFFPDEVWFFGAAGEEYRAVSPPGLSPTFAVKAKATGESLIDVQFPGSC